MIFAAQDTRGVKAAPDVTPAQSRGQPGFAGSYGKPPIWYLRAAMRTW